MNVGYAICVSVYVSVYRNQSIVTAPKCDAKHKRGTLIRVCFLICVKGHASWTHSAQTSKCSAMV